MDSNYSALSKDSDVELQVKNVMFRSDDEPFRLISRDGKLGNVKPNNAGAVDLEDVPLVIGNVTPGLGICGALFNLTTSIIGAGVMALRATMKVLGLVLGLVPIVLMGILFEISVFVIVQLSVHNQAESYGKVVQSALGRVGGILSEICIMVNIAGVLLVYLIIMGDVLSGSIRHIGVFDQLLGDGMWDHKKLLILVILVLFLAPLCAVDKIDSLTSTSALCVPLAIVFVVVTFTIAIIKLVEGKIEPPRMTPDFGSKKAILDLLMSNACVYHFSIQQIYNELEGRSPHKLNRVSRITTVICVLVYVSTAISCYLLFGKDTEADVLTNFDEDLGIRFISALNYIVRIGYVLHLILVFLLFICYSFLIKENSGCHDF